MPTLNLGCPCGATLAYTGSDGYAASRHREFTDAHAGHEAAAIAAQLEQVAAGSAVSIDDLRDLAKEITAQLTAATKPPPTHTPKAGTHVDVELQPGETITIRGREHPDHDPLIVLRGRFVTDATEDGNALPAHLRLETRYAVAWRENV